MTFSSVIALLGGMFALAIIPSVSVLAVSAKSAAYGFMHGVFTTMGIMVGDIFFILLTIFGLSFLAKTMGDLFVFVNYLAGVYLIGFGIKLWKSKSQDVKAEGIGKSSLLSSFLTGLFITLGDQKAILFYFAFFPAFLDLSTLSYFDAGIIIMIDLMAVGGAKLAYAYMADKSRSLFTHPKAKEKIHVVASCLMIVVGILLLIKTR